MIELVMLIGLSGGLVAGALMFVNQIKHEKDIEFETAMEIYKSLGLDASDYLTILERSKLADYGHYSVLWGVLSIVLGGILLSLIFDNNKHKSIRLNFEDMTQSSVFIWIVGFYSAFQYSLISFIDRIFSLYLKESIPTLTVISVLVGLSYVFIKKMISAKKEVRRFEDMAYFRNTECETRLYYLMKSRFVKSETKLNLLEKHYDKLKQYGTAGFLCLPIDYFKYHCHNEYLDFVQKKIEEKDSFDKLFNYRNEHILNDSFREVFEGYYNKKGFFKDYINNHLSVRKKEREYFLSKFNLKNCYSYLYDYDNGLIDDPETMKQKENEYVCEIINN